MIERVLVPLDGSMLAEVALEPALHLAQRNSGSIYLMRVPIYSDTGAQTGPNDQDAWATEDLIPEHEDAAAYLREIRSKVSQPGVSVRTMVVEGDRANAIVDTAVTNDIDLIIMGTHARTGMSRWLYGGIAGKVIRQTRSPLLLLRKPCQLKHILITLDGSQMAELIIDPALALADAFGSRITAIQVENQPTEQMLVTDDESYLDGIVSRCQRSGLQAASAGVTGPVADTILSYASENDVDLIAMSTQGRSGLQKLIYGSVTEKVMSDCKCAMLIIRPVDQESS